MFATRSGVTTQPLAAPWDPAAAYAPPSYPPPPKDLAAQNETAPVFLQFLDAIAQLIAQFPTVAQFDERALAILWSAAYSRTFVNFRHDCERDRALDRRPGPSVWPKLAACTNALYAPAAAPLRPTLALKTLTLCAMYLPHDAPPSPLALLRTKLDREKPPVAAAAADDAGPRADDEDPPEPPRPADSCPPRSSSSSS